MLKELLADFCNDKSIDNETKLKVIKEWRIMWDDHYSNRLMDKDMAERYGEGKKLIHEAEISIM